MRRIFLAITLAVIGLLCLNGSVQAQNYPMPAQTEVICTAAQCPQYPNLPTPAFSTPITQFAGRFIDSNLTREFQQPLRTLRAHGVGINPAKNRVYMILGSLFAAYDLDTFFNSRLGQPLTNVSSSTGGTLAPDRGQYGPEQYLQFDAKFYAEGSGTGWNCPTVDGQDRLYDFDWDDRGYVYLAYSAFGWGILSDDGSNKLTSVKQVYGSGKVTTNPTKILTVRSGTKYYTFVSDKLNPNKIDVNDVTTPASPALLRTLTFGAVSWARTTGGTVALIDGTGNLQIYAVDDLANGRAPKQTFTPTGGSQFNGVSSDGTNFYTAQSSSRGANAALSFFRYAGGSFVETDYPFGYTFTILGVRYSSGYVSAWGYINPGYKLDTRVFKLASGVPQAVNIGTYFPDYYTAGITNHAKPAMLAGVVTDVTVYTYSGKDYLFWSNNSMGDVYVLQGGDGIDIRVDSSQGWGTQNPNNPNRTQGPYLADPVTFTSSATGGNQLRVHWNLDNPENTAVGSYETTTGVSFKYQYAGLTSAAAITDPKNVSGYVTTDPTITDSFMLSLLAPTSRVGISGTTSNYSTAADLAAAPVVYGDQFVDASDGSVESHYDIWSVDAATATTIPTASQAAGLCGAHTLTFETHYVPYSGTTTITPTLPVASHYIHQIAGSAYTVKPFVAQLKIDSSTSTTITFKNITRYGSSSIFAQGTSTPTSVTWELRDANNNLVSSSPVTSTIATQDRWTINKSSIPANGRVVMTVSILSGITDTACAAYATSSTSINLVLPDPTINVSGCARVGDPCSITASSIGGNTTSGWTYAWTLNGSAGSSQATYSPSFPSAGTYTIGLTASNTIGSGTATRTINVQPSLCSGAASTSTLSINWKGTVDNCSSSPCAANEPISFSPYAWSPYKFQDCDTFKWDFGDGSTSTQKTVTHTYPGNGPYIAKLTVSNPNGGATVSSTIQFGNGGGGGGGTCTKSPSNLSINYSGSTSGCSPLKTGCYNAETIGFTPQAFGYTFQSCDSYSWNFGDGGSSTARNAAHVYATTGTYTVRLTVTNQNGTASTSDTVTVQQAPPQGCNPPSGYPDFTVSGATSGCTATSGSCIPNEVLTFSGSAFGYTIQSCDTFQWDFGDGATASGKNTTHTYAKLGNYVVTMKIKNSSGEKSTQRTLNVGVGAQQPPRVSITAPTGSTFSVNAPIAFAGVADPPDGIISYRWTFGDGGTSNLPTPTHTYAHAGTYNVTFSATNGGGPSNPAAQKTITIVDAVAFKYLLPAVAHVDGYNNTKWRTDLQVYNSDTANPLHLTFTYTVTGEQKTLDIASSTAIIEDLLAQITPNGGNGAVTVEGTAKALPNMWTRTYTIDGSGVGTYGQLIPAIQLLPVVAQNTTTNGTMLLSGLEATDRFRTNIGLVNTSPAAVTVTLSAFDVNDAPLGQKAVSLNPFQLAQFSKSDLTGFNLPTDKPFSVKIDGPASSFISYGSKIDNISNDPVYYSGREQDEFTAEAMSDQILPGVGHVTTGNGTWKSDVVIYNPDDTAWTLFDLTYYDQSGTPAATATSLVLGPGQILNYEDVLKSTLFTQTPADGFGMIRMTLKAGSEPTRKPLLLARTYNDQLAAGTYGQGIEGVAASIGNASATRDALVPGVRNNDAYVTNLGLVNLSALPTEVHVFLLDKTSGAQIAEWAHTLAPYESVIAPNIVGDPALLNNAADSGTLRIHVTSGGPLWAYASVIDKTTKDPEYVPAVPAN